MNPETISLLRMEILLVIQIFLLIILDLFASERVKSRYDLIALLMFCAVTVVGFIPQTPGEAFGGMFSSGKLDPVLKSILNIGVILIFLQSKTWLNDTFTKHKKGEAYVLILSTLLGMYLMISAGHFLIFYIGLELASLPLGALVAFNKKYRGSAEAGAKFILMSAFSAGILLFGVSLIYGSSGADGLYFSSVGDIITPGPMELVGMLFFLAGMAFKISLVPFHQWAPDVYQGAPVNITAYLSSISKGAAVFALTLVLFKVFGPLARYWEYVVYGLIIATITIGNLFAMRQQNIKRFLAYSSISQAGYIMLGTLSGSPEGMTAAVYYVAVYIMSNLGAFTIISVVGNITQKFQITDYNGFYKTNPKLSVAMMFFLFSLAGIPPFAGFFSKFFVFMAAAGESYYILVFIALINTVISLYYYLLIVKAMFISSNDEPIEKIETDSWSKAALLISLFATIFIGILSSVYGYIGNHSSGI